MTTESSQPAPQPAQTVQPKSASNQSVRIAALVVLGLVIVGVVLYLIFGHNSTKKHHKKGNGAAAITTAIGPVLKNKQQLVALQPTLAQPVWWAGPQPGKKYEFWRLKSDRIYIRYLPKGTPAGAPGENYLIVSTYPFPQAYQRLKKGTNNNGTIGQDGAYVWQRPNDPRSVLMAWPGKAYEVEVFNPSGTLAKHLALSGQIKPIG